MNYSFFIRLAHMEKYFSLKENGISVWALVFHVVERLLSVMRCQELCSDWTSSGCVQVIPEEFSLLSLPCNIVESHTHIAQFYAGYVLMSIEKKRKYNRD